MDHQVPLFDKTIVKMFNIFCLLVLCLVNITSHRVHGSHITLEDDLELERQLNLINKPPIKSIHSKFGYIVDCIDIYKQPAFDHPLLKNHKLQRRPRFHVNEKTSVNNSQANSIFELEKVECPSGTVPIRRTTKDDLIRAKSLWNVLSTNGVVKHTAEVTKRGERYYGISGTTSIYNPKLNIAQSSSSHAYIQNGVGDRTNKIIFGWHVFQHLYGNDRTHVFAAWTSDNFKKTGCYNLQCRGFVQTDSQFHIGGVVSKVSVYGGPMIDLPIEIFKETNRWWLSISKKIVGYFPVALFTNLNEANLIGWGGGTIAIGASNPPMGSGYFPDDDFYHSGYFINIKYKNAPNSAFVGPRDKYAVQTNADALNCYRVKFFDANVFARNSLQFGGPGGNCN